ncbi:MAG: GNAT family N-acetyltransferase [Acidaminococcaceae bacterium]|nr:GNAT family N-acetyltransferase [Acidaminococcaceae bacterium]HAY61331.1 GNAT family N-acetyltransferase [Acidaminococcaceae bacterium]HCJ91559.1 GNAT family N-acetyltransferase [Acidaminococcaceae bacterium]
MEIRKATSADVEAVAAVEAACFPAAEAATEAEFRDRLAVYGNHFLLLFDEDRLVGFIDGFVTDEKDLRDEMYADASLHDEQGAWQMIFGLNTVPPYRRRGCAGRLIEALKTEARKEGRKGIVLTCKDKLVPYYARFGFVSEGVSGSTHGGVTWYQMRLTF